MAETEKINKDIIIGDLISKYPESQKVIEKYFGGGCFTCPGIKMESISFGAMMHNINADAVVSEINEIIDKK